MLKDFRDEKETKKERGIDDLTFTNLVSIEAIINLMVKKKIVTKDELNFEINLIKAKWKSLSEKE